MMKTDRLPAAPGQAYATVEIHRDLSEVAALWTALMPEALATPYQNPAFLRAWVDHAAGPEGVEPLIVVARDASGRPVALLPFGLKRRAGIRVARFLGGSHVNYNLPVIRRDSLAAFAGGDAMRLLRDAAKIARIDAFALSNQPHVWEGFDNPFAALPRQPSPDAGFSGPLAPSLEEHLKRFVSAKSRSNQRRKMRRFEELGHPLIYRAETAAQRARLLDAYFDQKARQFEMRGVANVFERQGVHEFLADACGLSGAAPTVEIYGFELDGEIISVTGGLADRGRYCGMFISITSGERAKYSPGEMLMNFVVEDSIRRGLSIFDLGVGAAAYKKMYCPDAVPLFDSIFGVTLRGRAAAAAVAGAAAAKARVKASPRAYALLDRARKAMAGRRSAASAEDHHS
ncbi:GNAT family N-acetyltransferase [Hansschlegelia zhihuaiae]|uniref:GNAT family N-acetyltransferase n=1 Tax=Hansschlegelia zhihuaiae TaxID=405005 RepID=A0A4Q0MPN8_9HYPH|nr:GNAT family N-acetyltransferase [Hansschlegelia zhihuaiae]RXF75129.1 GNAT family N-acetyltransferase [Hansschlegelia zhihuaiae]